MYYLVNPVSRPHFREMGAYNQSRLASENLRGSFDFRHKASKVSKILPCVAHSRILRGSGFGRVKSKRA